MGGTFKKTTSLSTNLPPLTLASLQETLQAARVTVKTDYGKGHIVLTCAAPVQAHGKMVLGVLKQLLPQNRRTVIDAGPIFVELKDTGTELVCHQPDFLQGDPKNDACQPDMTQVCLLLGHQVQLSRETSTEAKNVSFFECVQVDPAAWHDQVVMLRRLPAGFEGDSGWWVIGTNAMHDVGPEPTYEQRVMWETFRARPAWTTAMGLPDDHLAIFDGEELKVVRDPRDKVLLKR